VHRALQKAEYFAQPTRTVSTAGRAVLGISAELRNRATIRTLFVLVNLVVVISVNVLYVYIAIYQSSALLVLAQVLMSFFKLLWSSTCMDAVLRWLVGAFAPELVYGDISAKAYRTEFLSLQLFVSLLNSIAIPCLVVAGISPDCFYNVFQPAPTVRSSFTFLVCASFVNGQCVQVVRATSGTEYDTPYTYNYQCSSSLITYYAPAYVNLCILAVFVGPLGNVFAASVLRRTTPGSFVHSFLRRSTPRMLQEFANDVPGIGSSSMLMSTHALLITLVTYLGVLLTFGTMLPPLGVALAVTVALVVLFTKLKIGRFLCSAEEQSQLDKFVRILEQQCEAAGSASFLQSALWMLVTLSCLFYTIFLFDTLGDTVGFRRAVWVLIVVPLLPVVFYVGYGSYNAYIRMRRRDSSRQKEVEEAELSSVELTVVPVPPAVETYNAMIVPAVV
jgi:hypothetical protein